MDKIEAVRYLKELGKDATLEDGVVMLRSRATGAALDREYKAMKKDLKAAGTAWQEPQSATVPGLTGSVRDL